MKTDTRQYDDFVDETWFGGEENAQQIAALGVCGEAGEFAEKMKKRLRGDSPGPSNIDVINELGDILFYVTKSSHLMGFDLDEVMDHNEAKLKSRIARDKQRGSGDDR